MSTAILISIHYVNNKYIMFKANIIILLLLYQLLKFIMSTAIQTSIHYVNSIQYHLNDKYMLFIENTSLLS